MIDLLATRVAEIPAAVRAAGAVPLSGVERLASMDRFVVTGGGLSEGPARVLVALLQRAGRLARFVPQTRFVGWPEPADPRCGLVLFSQGLAPNARLPLPHRDRFGVFALVTSVTDPIDGLVWRVPPAREDKLLIRVVGPAVALVMALRIARACGLPLGEHDWAHLARPREGIVLGRPVALVADERLLDLAMPLRWKLLEGLRVPDPPVWDVLQVAHGPLQSIYDHPHTIVTLRCADARYDDLFARLRRVLPPHHEVVELRASIDGPAAVVELDALLDAALIATLRAHPISLDDWPSRGHDGPLYDVSPTNGGTE